MTRPYSCPNCQIWTNYCYFGIFPESSHRFLPRYDFISKRTSQTYCFALFQLVYNVQLILIWLLFTGKFHICQSLHLCINFKIKFHFQMNSFFWIFPYKNNLDVKVDVYIIQKEQLMDPKPTAVGSIWNVNSWHWEMKNYSQISKKILEQKILNLIYEPSDQIKIKHKKVKFTKSQCEVNVRKGKQILVYDFDVELDVVGEHESEDNSEGSYRVREILNDDLNDMIVDQIKATEKNKTAEEMKKWIKKNAKQHIINIFKEFEGDLIKYESDPKKLEEDKRKREENILATQKAKEEKGAEKERLLEEQKQKERKLKEEAYQKTIQNLQKNE